MQPSHNWWAWTRSCQIIFIIRIFLETGQWFWQLRWLGGFAAFWVLNAASLFAPNLSKARKMRPYPMRLGTKRKTFSVLESSLNDFSSSDMVDLQKISLFNHFLASGSWPQVFHALRLAKAKKYENWIIPFYLFLFLFWKLTLLKPYVFSETYKISWTIVTVK